MCDTDAMSTPVAAQSGKREYSRRSWFMPADDAAALARAVEDLHYELRMPKGDVLGLIVGVALAHLDEVREVARSAKP